MNEYNHHRIIGRFVSDNRENKNKLPSNIKDIFEKASNFTDSIMAESDYYFYHFYYDIQISGTDTIILSRVDEETNRSAQSMRRCGDLVPGSNPPSYIMRYSSKTDEKEFFSFINDRPRSPRHDVLDMGNQSDNVAFLHAMGAELGNGLSENPARSRALFEEHLKRCFAEYLFLKDEKKALFMLGIAMHGIMDSFTPSHMGFQHYTKQHPGLHAQGDVVPILDDKDKVEFEQGQFSHDMFAAMIFDAIHKEYVNPTAICNYIQQTFVGKIPSVYLYAEIAKYTDLGFLNSIEKEMLRIYLNICKLKLKIEKTEGDDNRSSDNKNGSICKENLATYTTHGNFLNGDDLWKSLQGKNLKEINNILSKYEYTQEAYIYSNAAIETIKEIYLYLSKKRKGIPKRNIYQTYKNNKKDILENALKKWKDKYAELEDERNAHLERGFYLKDSEVSGHAR